MLSSPTLSPSATQWHLSNLVWDNHVSRDYHCLITSPDILSSGSGRDTLQFTVHYDLHPVIPTRQLSGHGAIRHKGQNILIVLSWSMCIATYGLSGSRDTRDWTQSSVMNNLCGYFYHYICLHHDHGWSYLCRGCWSTIVIATRLQALANHV